MQKKCIKALLRSEEAKEILKEYTILLSAGFSDNDAENAIISFFLPNYPEPQQETFWISFALIQWKMGRLSKRVYAAALELLCDSRFVLSDEASEEIANLLASPMTERKKVVKPQTLKCPWPKGALLAYRIASNVACKDSRFWNQYVLLRIIDIKKWPLSSIAPCLLCDESMYVALYNWVGETLPEASLIANLEFTPISFRKPILARLSTDTDCSFKSSEFIYGLDWGSKKNAKAIFTGIHDYFDTNMFPDLGDQKTKIPPMIGCVGFDSVLIKRLEQLFPQHDLESI